MTMSMQSGQLLIHWRLIFSNSIFSVFCKHNSTTAVSLRNPLDQLTHSKKNAMKTLQETTKADTKKLHSINKLSTCTSSGLHLHGAAAWVYDSSAAIFPCLQDRNLQERNAGNRPWMDPHAQLLVVLVYSRRQQLQVPSARWDAFWTHSSAQLTHSLAIE
jgi:hypothetical protein